MGIELELHAGRPSRKKWVTSLVRGSYEHGEALAQVLAKLHVKDPGRLPAVDPYGNTLFNEQEAEVALGETPGLLERCAHQSQVDAVNDLAAMLKACAATPGSYLLFVGD